jgi:hypothetical protein
MTRTLALDAYRYVSRDYANPSAQCAKMARRHGIDAWCDATMIASEVYHANRSECMAVVIGKIEERLR